MNEAAARPLPVAARRPGGLILRSSADEHPAPADIRRELVRVIESAAFDASERNRRFFCYVVEETLAGRASRIKAYSIATAVFGRDASFDPQADPVVRMEAQRLRRSLERFYLTDGRDDAVRILLPKGGYVPQFRTVTARMATLAPAPACRAAPTILVQPFDIETDGASLQMSETGLGYQLMIALSSNPCWRVLGAAPARPFRGGTKAAGAPAPDAADFVLHGSKAVLGDVMLVKAVMIDARTGRVAWGRSFERAISANNPFATRDAMANAIARALPSPGDLAGDRSGSAEATARSGRSDE